MISVAVADDHHLVRQGIIALLERADDIEVVGEVDDGDQALTLVAELAPDVLLMDVSMPNRSGLEVLEELNRIAPGTSVVILTMHADEAVVRRAMEGGAKGYVLKGSIADDLMLAIRVAHQGGTFIAPGTDEPSPVTARSRAPAEPLSPREHEVLELIGEGKTNKAVASALSISVKTVERHRTSIMRKLDTRNVVELIRSAARLGYIRLDD